MNEYFCSKCFLSIYSAVDRKTLCIVCGGNTIKNPEKGVKQHLMQFREVTNVNQPKEAVMNIKLIIKIVVLIIAAIVVYLNKGIIASAVLGGALAVVYFSLTGSTLNWKIPKKK